MSSFVAYEHIFSQDTLKNIKFYREQMNAQPLYSALRSFEASKNPQNSTRQPGVYEIREGNRIIYIGGNASPCHICDSLCAHFSGNDGLSIGFYLNGPARERWSEFYVRWLPCNRPHQVAVYLLQDYQLSSGSLPKFNLPPDEMSSY